VQNSIFVIEVLREENNTLLQESIQENLFLEINFKH